MENARFRRSSCPNISPESVDTFHGYAKYFDYIFGLETRVKLS